MEGKFMKILNMKRKFAAMLAAASMVSCAVPAAFAEELVTLIVPAAPVYKGEMENPAVQEGAFDQQDAGDAGPESVLSVKVSVTDDAS